MDCGCNRTYPAQGLTRPRTERRNTQVWGGMTRQNMPEPERPKPQAPVVLQEETAKETDFMDYLKVATIYFLPQPYGAAYKPDEVLLRGTYFPSLYMPYHPNV